MTRGDVQAVDPRRPPPAVWSSDGFAYGEFRFKPIYGSKIGVAREDYPSFVLMKDAANVAAYEENLTGPVFDMIELGIMKGGSCAFFEVLLRPRTHLAIDVYGFEGDGLKELEKHVSSMHRRFYADYDTNQTDVERILDLWQNLTGERKGFDLIVDDASHNYELSLKSFNGLFPLLRPGGIYALEDWGWAHWGGDWQDPTHPEFSSPSLSNLVVQAAFSVTAGSKVVESVKVTPNAAFIVRGPNPTETFNVELAFENRGHSRCPF